jgi:hypothetical protein
MLPPKDVISIHPQNKQGDGDMKLIAKTKTALMVSLLSLTMVSCTEEIEQAISENSQATDGQQEGQQGQYGSQNYDQDYANAMENNFDGYQAQQGDNCYHMRDQYAQDDYRLPPRRPTQYTQSRNGNQYGMAVDGSRISQGQNGFQFETSPYQLVNDRGNGKMIGVHRDGAPIYAKYASPYEQPEQLDQNGGRYGKTQDFPSGIYHYVITLNVNNN